MIRIEARLYATLRKYHPEGKVGEALVRELAEGTTVQELLEGELRVPPNEIKTVFVNGMSRSFDYVLADGDRVGIFPPVGGG
ncbi:MAG: MoaD/ThiS family protein [Anaerolineae bacterium]|nr:MoaD/ThiS family protein [Anaerolineae bacterium]